MPRRSATQLALLALPACWACLGAAEDPWQSCRGIAEDAARLACYDAMPRVSTMRTASSVASGGAAEAARAGTIPRPSVDSFGQPRTAPAELDFIESTFAETVDGWRPGSLLRLDNGQVWQVSDDSRAFVRPGRHKVKVRRGTLGTYFLEVEGTNHSPRVRRVQ